MRYVVWTAIVLAAALIGPVFFSSCAPLEDAAKETAAGIAEGVAAKEFEEVAAEYPGVSAENDLLSNLKVVAAASPKDSPEAFFQALVRGALALLVPTMLAALAAALRGRKWKKSFLAVSGAVEREKSSKLVKAIVGEASKIGVLPFVTAAYRKLVKSS